MGKLNFKEIKCMLRSLASMLFMIAALLVGSYLIVYSLIHAITYILMFSVGVIAAIAGLALLKTITNKLR